ncbi:protein kinase 5 [Senna tora]|uniref:Protein kinase 5 n=1 Tax=Senna tora TaxID=362788 RepID=A0A834TZR7_9FABA|nr:protein kinase 5 [Senna tora]
MGSHGAILQRKKKKNIEGGWKVVARFSRKNAVKLVGSDTIKCRQKLMQKSRVYCIDVNRISRTLFDYTQQLNHNNLSMVYFDSSWYKAPELVYYKPAMDVWSVGIIFTEMVTRRPISTQDVIMNCKKLDALCPGLEQDGLDLLSAMFCDYPDSRISVANALSHHYFNYLNLVCTCSTSAPNLGYVFLKLLHPPDVVRQEGAPSMQKLQGEVEP